MSENGRGTTLAGKTHFFPIENRNWKWAPKCVCVFVCAIEMPIETRLKTPHAHGLLLLLLCWLILISVVIWFFFLRSVLSFGCFLICLYTPWVRMISSFYSAFAERQNKSTISINLFSGCFVCRLLFCFILFRHICVVVSVFIYVRVNWFFIRFSIDAIGKRWHKHKQSCVLLR